MTGRHAPAHSRRLAAAAAWADNLPEPVRWVVGGIALVLCAAGIANGVVAGFQPVAHAAASATPPRAELTGHADGLPPMTRASLTPSPAAIPTIGASGAWEPPRTVTETATRTVTATRTAAAPRASTVTATSTATQTATETVTQTVAADHTVTTTATVTVTETAPAIDLPETTP